MNQHGQDIILATYNAHVIRELCRINIYMLSRQHSDDVILKPVEVHLDIGYDSTVCAGCCDGGGSDAERAQADVGDRLAGCTRELDGAE